ncbi:MULTISPECIES: glycosyltransferase [Kurthia]|uniref:Glycosyltransferase n=1 Tax=Kurthia gibsonii TaxID=33946 RepID=A0ABU9LIZ5_9BACL|nr:MULTISPECIES: glycosyltransferase [unclassified Kurthia]AMA64580.1 glycosyl transferases group 1 family protein [Kurthia sp. 11kri321]WIL39052.1 glycosyltransferase [Kurthia sp. YJT4]
MKRKIFMAVNDVNINKGGINSVMFSRTHLFDNDKYSTALVTLDDKTNYPEIEKQLKYEGRIAETSEVINIFEYYRNKFTRGEVNEEIRAQYERNLQREEEGYHYQLDGKVARYFDNGRYVKYKRWDDEGRLRVVDYFSEIRVRIEREIYHIDGYLLQKETYHPSNNKVTQIHYYTKEGFCYLSRWFNHNTGKPQRIVLFSPDRQEAKVFPSNLEFHASFLEELCDLEEVKPIIICDGPGTSPKVQHIPAEKAIRIYTIHTNHLLEPYTIGSEVKPDIKHVLNNKDEDAPIVVLTNRQKIDIETQFSDRKWNIHVISNVAESELQVTKKHLNRVVTISRYNSEKRLDLLIQAFKKTVEVVPDAELHIYGDGPQKDALKKLIADLKLRKSVKLLPYTNDVFTKLSEGLFTVITSIYEGQSLVILEAMTQKVPAISFKVNYLVRELTDGTTGKVVPNGDIDALAEAMTDWLYTPEKALEVGEHAYQVVNEKYTRERQYQEWDELFEQEIAKQN